MQDRTSFFWTSLERSQQGKKNFHAVTLFLFSILKDIFISSVDQEIELTQPFKPSSEPVTEQ